MLSRHAAVRLAWNLVLGLACALPACLTPAQAQTRWVMATPYAENFHTLNIRQFIRSKPRPRVG